ncbi:hypothetical protein ACU4GD_43765 [Cupriavidus basilensis]
MAFLIAPLLGALPGPGSSLRPGLYQHEEAIDRPAGEAGKPHSVYPAAWRFVAASLVFSNTVFRILMAALQRAAGGGDVDRHR